MNKEKIKRVIFDIFIQIIAMMMMLVIYGIYKREAMMIFKVRPTPIQTFPLMIEFIACIAIFLAIYYGIMYTIKEQIFIKKLGKVI